MASLELDPGSGRYRVHFRYDGQEFKRSLRTKNKRVASSALGQVEETLRLLEMGLTEIPTTVDDGVINLSVSEPVANSLKLGGEAYWAKAGHASSPFYMAPFEIEFHFGQFQSDTPGVRSFNSSR